MEPNHDLYQKTFSRLKASPELKENILAATEQTQKPKKFIWRRVLAVAVAAALLFALAMGANAATGGELFQFSLGKLERVIPMDSGRYAYFYRNGNKLSVLVKDEYPHDMEPEVMPAPEDGQTHNIITLESGPSGSNDLTVRQVSLKIVSTAKVENTQTYTFSPEESIDGTYSIVYGDTVAIKVLSSEVSENIMIADVTVKVIDSPTSEDDGEEKSVSVTVDYQGSEESADGGEQPVIEAETE